MKKTCFKCFGVGHIANVCKKEKASWEQYKMFLKEKYGLGPEFIGKTIEVSQDLGSESVEPQVVDEIPAVDGSRTFDDSQLQTTDSTQEAVKTHLNVGEQAAGVMNEKSSHVTKTEKKVDNLRVSKRKRISHKKPRN